MIRWPSLYAALDDGPLPTFAAGRYMKNTIRLLIATITVTACSDSIGPPGFAGITDATFTRARTPAATTTLPTFGGTTAEAFAINDAGTVVGYAAETNSSRTAAGVAYTARWARDTVGRWKVTKLSTTPGGRAHALNERGDAVGERDGAALVWPASRGEERLGDGIALGINDAGIIVGGTQYGLESFGRVWTPDPAGVGAKWIMRALPPLEGGTFSLAFAINENGIIAGSARTASGIWKAVVWRPGADGWMIPVPLPGTEVSPGPSASFGLNTDGDVVGYLRACTTCSNHAYLWPVGGGSVDLTAWNSGTSTGRALGIENARRVVGELYLNLPQANDPSAFLSLPGVSTLTGLGSGRANDINNLTARFGQEVVGRSGSSTAVVWRAP